MQEGLSLMQIAWTVRVQVQVLREQLPLPVRVLLSEKVALRKQATLWEPMKMALCMAHELSQELEQQALLQVPGCCIASATAKSLASLPLTGFAQREQMRWAHAPVQQPWLVEQGEVSLVPIPSLIPRYALP